jgi:hypothetical protein
LHVILKGSVVSGDDVKQMHVGTGSKSGGWGYYWRLKSQGPWTLLCVFYAIHVKMYWSIILQKRFNSI